MFSKTILKTTCFLLFFVFLATTSCKKEEPKGPLFACEVDEPATQLSWLKDKIDNISTINGCNSSVKVYTYKGEETIFVDDCPNLIADQLFYLYDCDGKELCAFGGFAGINTCPDFDSTATFVKQIWP